MDRAFHPSRTECAAGFSVVLAIHGFALWGLWQHKLIPAPQEAMTLFVNFIAPTAPDNKVEPKPAPPRQQPS
jgi:protein TonB